MRILIVIAALAGCGGGSKDDPAAGGSGNGATAVPGGAVVEAWKQGGLKPSALATASTPIGKDCAAGSVNNVDVVVCQFGSADDAKAAEKAGWDWVGGTTGTAWVSGSLVIAAADRKKADPNGKTINQMMKLAPK